MAFDTSVIVAFSAVTGSVVGACASVTITFVGQRLQARWSRLAAELVAREQLYGHFVEEAVPLFVDAIERPGVDAGKMMRLFAIVAHIRLTCSDDVLRAAELVGRRLLEFYERAPQDPAAVLARVAKGDDSLGRLDPLREFTEACRRERATILRQL